MDRALALAWARRAALYLGAIAIALGALALRALMDPWLGNGVPYITLFGAAALSVWMGGWRPAVLASVLGYVLLDLHYAGYGRPERLLDTGYLLQLALFALSCAFIIGLGEGMRRARDRHRASEAALRERAAQLQRANANKSQFLAVLSHELRNPLAPLRTGLAILRLSPDPASTRQVQDMMERQIAQLTRLIDDLLDVSRIDRGKLELRVEPLALDAVVRAAVETAMPEIEGKGHELVVRYAGKPLYVHGDAARLGQVVANLLNNAARYTPEKGRIELATRAEAGSAVLAVSDTGIGIAPEHLFDVFDMFVQVDPSRTAAAGGLGLGLTLVRSIVRAHDGEIEARSEGLGKGTQFIVRLPLAAALPAAATAAAAAPASPAGRRILVADDNADASHSLAQLLRLAGHEVREVHDGLAALAAAEAMHPDVAFIDLNMPGMDGLALARRLRETLWGRAIKLVALTGMGQELDVARTSEAGFDLHLTKPADPAVVTRLAAGADDETNVIRFPRSA